MRALRSVRRSTLFAMATYDPLHSAKNTDPSEYGGSGGLVQPKAGPFSAGGLQVGHDPLTAQEARTMITREALRSAGVMEDMDPSDEEYDAVLVLAAEREEIYASGHGLDDAIAVSG